MHLLADIVPEVRVDGRAAFDLLRRASDVDAHRLQRRLTVPEEQQTRGRGPRRLRCHGNRAGWSSRTTGLCRWRKPPAGCAQSPHAPIPNSRRPAPADATRARPLPPVGLRGIAHTRTAASRPRSEVDICPPRSRDRYACAWRSEPACADRNRAARRAAAHAAAEGAASDTPRGRPRAGWPGQPHGRPRGLRGPLRLRLSDYRCRARCAFRTDRRGRRACPA